MNLRCAWEPLATVLAEPNAVDLIRAYADELSPLRDTFPVDPDWQRLARLEAEGAYKLWVSRVDGTLAGFISFFVMPHYYYRSVLSAQDAGHYLAPAFRGNGRVGYRMWRSVEPALRELGVRYVMAHDGERSLLAFMLALGYEPRGVFFYKVL